MRVEEFIARYGVRWLYHFTDVKNLGSIRRRGLFAHSELAAQGIEVCRPGADDESHAYDRKTGLDTYVHLCLVDNYHPMEWKARTTQRIGSTRFVKISVEVLKREGVVGCTKLTNSRGAVLLPIEKALDEMDLDILFGREVADADPRAAKERLVAARKAEIMVPRHIPLAMIDGTY